MNLISPFLGRNYDWDRKERGGVDIPAEKDPGLSSVARISNYFRKLSYPTQVTGASFRRVEQIVGLAGRDLFTISPDRLEQMKSAEGGLARRLSIESTRSSDEQKIHLDEKTFRWLHNEDAMATEKLREDIRKFNADTRKLENFARAKAEELLSPAQSNH